MPNFIEELMGALGPDVSNQLSSTLILKIAGNRGLTFIGAKLITLKLNLCKKSKDFRVVSGFTESPGFKALIFDPGDSSNPDTKKIFLLFGSGSSGLG
jgi:hypothetical protein